MCVKCVMYANMPQKYSVILVDFILAFSASLDLVSVIQLRKCPVCETSECNHKKKCMNEYVLFSGGGPQFPELSECLRSIW